MSALQNYLIDIINLLHWVSLFYAISGIIMIPMFFFDAEEEIKSSLIVKVAILSVVVAALLVWLIPLPDTLELLFKDYNLHH